MHSSEIPWETSETPKRALVLTKASAIAPRPVRWLWHGRIPLGCLSLVGGREGIGKSTLVYALAADVTRGRLVGHYVAEPKSVIVCATEDSWAHTVVPRLMGAGADLDRVFRVEVQAADGSPSALSLPLDLAELERAIVGVDAALVIADPLMSRLEASLDTHRDAEARQALEPLAAVCARTNVALVGLIHVNKSTSADALTSIMGSRAFVAVARAVLYVMVNPEDDRVRLVGLPKNNLGSTDVPTLRFQIEGAHVASTDEGDVWTGRLRWDGESAESIHDALQALRDTSGDKTAIGEAADWLEDYLNTKGGTAESAEVKREGRTAGHSPDALKRARRVLRVTAESRGFPRRTWWALPVGASPRTLQAAPTAPTALTDASRETASTHTLSLVERVQSVQSGQSGESGAAAPTEPGGRHAERL